MFGLFKKKKKILTREKTYDYNSYFLFWQNICYNYFHVYIYVQQRFKV